MTTAVSVKTSMLKTAIFDLYDTAHFNVWVEDELTRIFLSTVWNDKDIRVLNAGSKDGVKNLLKGAPLDVRGKTVVGLVDLDFDVPHYEWEHASRHVVTTEVHEFENYLLAFDLLAKIAKDTPANIESIAKAYAENVRYWMACKHTLCDLRRKQSTDFPADPKPQNAAAQFMTEAEAVEHISKSSYWNKQRDSMRNFNEAYFTAQVTQRAQEYKDDLGAADAKWTMTFSGKEIFRHVRVKTPGLASFQRSDFTPAQNDEDLARRIATKLTTAQFAQHPLKLKFDAWKVALKNRV